MSSAAGVPTRPSSSIELPEHIVPGRSPAMARLYETLAEIAPTDLPVLLRGETGVGKEHLARLVHAASDRRDGPCLTLNCAAIPADLLEAELFGIEAGVASGVRARTGRFRQAHGGTLFLDEIGDLPPVLQPKLLRALEDGEILPLGGTATRVDLRLVAATHADLARRTEQGRFRLDLYYRLAGVEVDVPPLTARREDIPALVSRFGERTARRLSRRWSGVEPAALARLVAASWPGNVRQLEHTVSRLVIEAKDGPIEERAVAEALARSGPRRVHGADAGPIGAEVDLNLARHVATLEERLIVEALRRGGSISEAARLLGLSRNGLKSKCRRLGLKCSSAQTRDRSGADQEWSRSDRSIERILR